MIFGNFRQQTELLKSASATSISTSSGHAVYSESVFERAFREGDRALKFIRVDDVVFDSPSTNEVTAQSLDFLTQKATAAAVSNVLQCPPL